MEVLISTGLLPSPPGTGVEGGGEGTEKQQGAKPHLPPFLPWGLQRAKKGKRKNNFRVTGVQEAHDPNQRVLLSRYQHRPLARPPRTFPIAKAPALSPQPLPKEGRRCWRRHAVRPFTPCRGAG